MTLWQGDALEYMQSLEPGSINAIITDLPYGTTACAWDSIIPFAPMWQAVKRVLMPRGVFVTTASQPFTSKLVMSNLEMFKYSWVWNKGLAGNIFLTDIQPLKIHEDICVFFGNTYYPQKTKRKLERIYKDKYGGGSSFGKKGTGEKQWHLTDKCPVSILDISNANKNGNYHPTQKPIALYKYLILTYTNPGDTVLDFCFGSGTTAVACVETGRNFAGCESNADYFAIASKRIHDAQQQPGLFDPA